MKDASWRDRSRAFRFSVMIAGGLAVAVAGLWLARASVTEWAIERSIDRFGLGPSDVEISSLGPGRAEMRLVSSAAGTIDRIGVEYRLGHLLSGRADRMTIEGTKIKFAWRDGKLVPAITPSEGPIVLPIARIDIDRSSLTLDIDGEQVVADVSGEVTSDGGPIAADMALALRGPQGAMTGRIAGTMQPDGALNGTFTVASGDVAVGTVKASTLTGALRLATSARGLDLIDGAFGFDQISSGGAPLGPGHLTVLLRQPENKLALTLDSKPLAFALRADGSKPASGVPFTVDGTATAGFLGGLAGAVKDADGTVRLKASGTTPPADSLQAAGSLGLGDWLRQGTAEGELSGTVSGLEIPGAVRVADARASLTLKLAAGAFSLATPDGVTVSGLELDKSMAAPGSLLAGKSSLSIAPAAGSPFLSVTPADGLDKIVLGGNVTFETPQLFLRGEMEAGATLDPAQWSAAAASKTAAGDVTLRADLALKLPEGRTLPSAELSVDGKYEVGPDRLHLASDLGSLTLRNAHWGETLALPGTARAVIQPGASVTRDRRTGEMQASLVLRPFNWNATMARKGAEPAKLAIAADRLALDMDKAGRRIVLEKGKVEMPDNGVAARGIAATITSAGDTTDIKAAIADLRGTGEPALFLPLKATLEAHMAGDKAIFSGGLADGGKKISVTAKGSHNLASGKGSASFTLKPIDLSGDGTIKALSPKLAASVTSGTGIVSGDGKIQWGDNAPPGTLTLALKDVGLSGEAIKLSGVNGGIRLDSLTPMRTAAGQRVTGTVQLPTVNQVPFDVTFRLEPDKLVLEHATAKVFDGEFATDNAEIDATTGDGRIDLKISDINLETAFAVLDLEQLKGTGRIGGLLPLRIEGGKVSVEKGHLESSVPGTVQVGVQTLADQLKSYGENVDLAFRALTDFHYDRMVIDAGKPFSGAGKAVFRLEGNNPAVMDGQPFVFNISLETDFDYLTKLLLELSGAANTALGWGARELSTK